MNFYEEIPAGVTEPATQPVVEPTEVTPGETPVTTPEKQYVPLERFQEVNNDLKAMKEQLAALAPKEPVAAENEDLDPEAEKMLSAWAKKNGLVTQVELQAQQNATKFQTDMADLTTKNKGFAPDKVAAFAKENLGGDEFLTTKSAYQLVWDKMTEGERTEAAKKAALTATPDPASYSEKPGAGGAKAPAAPASTAGMSSRDRIRAVRERITGTQP